MALRPARLRLGGAIVIVLALMAGAAWLTLRTDVQTVDRATAARTSFPDLPPAADAPPLPSLTTLSPKPGTVVEASGPFDDRFHFSGLAFDGTTLSGSTEITSDVSEILELETLAGFYDRDGKLIGVARDIYHLDGDHADHEHEGKPELTRAFSIRVPKDLAGRAVAAAVGVPVLVNE